MGLIGRRDAGLGEGGHAAIQGEGVHSCAGVVVGNEAVEQAGAAGGREGVEDGASVERGDEAAREGDVKPGAGVLLRDAIVVLQGDVGLPNHLIGREYLGVRCREGAEPFDTEREEVRGLAGDQPDEHGGINPDI